MVRSKDGRLGRVPEVGMLLPQIGDFALRLAFDAVVVATSRLGLVLALLPEQQPADEEEHGDRVGEVEGVPGEVPRPVFRCRETARARKRGSENRISRKDNFFRSTHARRSTSR